MVQAQSDGEPQRSARWQTRRQEIVDTSARLFARNGYHATGIAELCTANGLGKGALYHYIGSKEELLAAIHDRVMDEVLQGAERVAAAGGSPSGRLAMLGEELLDVIARYPDHVWVFLHEFPALTGDRATRFRDRRRHYERQVEAVLRDGVATGEFRDVDTRLTSLAWLGMHNYTYLWLKPGGRLSARDVAKPFADIFLSGISQVPSARSTARRTTARTALGSATPTTPQSARTTASTPARTRTTSTAGTARAKATAAARSARTTAGTPARTRTADTRTTSTTTAGAARGKGAAATGRARTTGVAPARSGGGRRPTRRAQGAE